MKIFLIDIDNVVCGILNDPNFKDKIKSVNYLPDKVIVDMTKKTNDIDNVIHEISNDPKFENMIMSINYLPDKAIVDMTKKDKEKKYTNEIDCKNALKASKTKYMLNKSWFCAICGNNKNYTLAGKWCHLQTLKHKKNIEKYENMNKINLTLHPERDSKIKKEIE